MNTETLINTSMPFSPFEMLKKPGRPQKTVILWFILCAIAIPSSAITRYLEWTGVELSVGGLSFYFTIYIPMLICVPLVIWYGYLWAAIPAYFSTFLVAYIGGMPLGWIALFSFANPLTLALYTLSYQMVRARPNMGGLVPLVGFILISFIASLAGSSGSFIWAYANMVGLNEFLPVWQGWWFGGWLQAILIVLPILHFAGPYVENWVEPLKSQNAVNAISYKKLTLTTILFVVVLVGYVMAARFISIEQFNTIKETLAVDTNQSGFQNVIDGLTYPLYILLTVMLALTYMVYKAVIFWQQALIKANQKLTEKNIALEKLATTDFLTTIFNRRKVMELATSEFERSSRNGNSLSVLMVDIDKFKRINDEFGHLVGDSVISQVAKRLLEALRPYDAPGRYGGEEFIVLLPETSLNEALSIAKRVLSTTTEGPISTEKGQLKVTVSIGVASLLKSDQQVATTIERADQALLEAKSSGRNCVQCIP